MKEIQGGDEELVGVLLLISGQMVSVGPSHVEEYVRNKRGASTGVKFL